MEICHFCVLLHNSMVFDILHSIRHGIVRTFYDRTIAVNNARFSVKCHNDIIFM